MFDVTTYHVKLTFISPMLGTAPSDPELYDAFVASKAEDITQAEIDQELSQLPATENGEKGKTVFRRNDEGQLCITDFMVKGFFKETMKALRGMEGTICSKITSYKQRVDLYVFPEPALIPVHAPEVLTFQRPLRASTPQGERIALASSEMVPAGAWCEFKLNILPWEDKKRKVALDQAWIEECFKYAYWHGLGQWRNGGHGRFEYELKIWDTQSEVEADIAAA